MAWQRGVITKQSIWSFVGKLSLLQKQKLRQHIINKDAYILRDKAYIKDVKYDIRDDSVSDLILAYKANLQKHKNGSLKSVRWTVITNFDQKRTSPTSSRSDREITTKEHRS